MSLRAPAPSSSEKRLLDLLEAQARASKARLSDSELAKVMEAARANLHRLAGRTGQSLETVARQALAKTENVLAERSRPPAELHLERVFRKMPPEEQCRRYFTDPNTGLLNLRGLETLPPPPGRPLLAEWDIEAAKFINDQHGHDALNGALRAAARALNGEISDGAKIGGSLRGYVRDQGDAERIAAAIEKALDPARRVRTTTAVAPRASTIRATIDKTSEAHDEVKKLERATGRLGYRLGGPAAFMRGAPSIAFEEGMEGVDPKSPKAQRFLAEQVAPNTAPIVAKLTRAQSVEDLALTPEHRQAFGRLSAREIAETLFIERSTGLLTEQGFQALPERRWKASVDLRALRDLDQVLGHADADKVIASFGRVLAKVAGAEFDVAHLHGDEYALQSNSRRALKMMLGALAAECGQLGFYKQLADRRLVVMKGVEFAWGLGKDYERADRVDLPRRKELLPEARKPTLVPASRAERTLTALRGQGAMDVRRELSPPAHGLTFKGLAETVTPATSRERAPPATKQERWVSQQGGRMQSGGARTIGEQR
jgi:GGDEF domain-containing protein